MEHFELVGRLGVAVVAVAVADSRTAKQDQETVQVEAAAVAQVFGTGSHSWGVARGQRLAQAAERDLH